MNIEYDSFDESQAGIPGRTHHHAISEEEGDKLLFYALLGGIVMMIVLFSGCLYYLWGRPEPDSPPDSELGTSRERLTAHVSFAPTAKARKTKREEMELQELSSPSSDEILRLMSQPGTSTGAWTRSKAQKGVTSPAILSLESSPTQNYGGRTAAAVETHRIEEYEMLPMKFSEGSSSVPSVSPTSGTPDESTLMSPTKRSSSRLKKQDSKEKDE